MLSTSALPFGITIEELRADEDFDISFVTAIETTILTHLGQPQIPDRFSLRLLDILVKGAYQNVDPKVTHINYTAALSSTLTEPAAITSKSEAANGQKERFALSCLGVLFNICSKNKPGILMID